MTQRYFLYIKTHNKTGLKYLGKTIKDPYKYKGSGKYWLRHINVHGNDVITDILGMYEREQTLIKAGEFYSNLWNVVESNEWANLKPETGDGGGVVGRIAKEETKLRISKSNTGKRRTDEHKKNIGEAWKKSIAINGLKRTKDHNIKVLESARRNGNDNKHRIHLFNIITGERRFSHENEAISLLSNDGWKRGRK